MPAKYIKKMRTLTAKIKDIYIYINHVIVTQKKKTYNFAKDVSSQCRRIDPPKVTYVTPECRQIPRKILPSMIPIGDEHLSGPMSNQTCGQIVHKSFAH